MSQVQFTSIHKQQISDAIKTAESNTSGEIRIHIENHCKEDILDHAAYIFDLLNMHKTELRNGVLIYIAMKNRQFAIIGDVGINQKVPNDFWDVTKDKMAMSFKQGDFVGGLSGGILSVGEQLKKFFPANKVDKNELSDEISFGN